MTKQLKELCQNVLDWAKARGIDQQTAYIAFNKYNEEVGEVDRNCIAYAITNDKRVKADAIDALGDCTVTLINLIHTFDLDPVTIIDQSFVLGQPENLKGLIHDLYLQGTVLSRQIARQQHVSLDEIQQTLSQIALSLAVIAKQLNLDLTQCLQAAYDEIKDRRGRTENGTYVKDADRVDGQDHQH